MHEMRVAARNAKSLSSFFVLLIVFAFGEAANTCSLLIVFLQQIMQQIRRLTCIKPASNLHLNHASNLHPNLQQIMQQIMQLITIRLHHTNKVHHSICLARVLISIHFVLVYLHDILQLTRN